MSALNLFCQNMDDSFLPEDAIESPYMKSFLDYKNFDISELRQNNFKEIIGVEFRNVLTDAGEYVGPGKTDTVFQAKFNDKMQILYQFARNNGLTYSYRFYYESEMMRKIIVCKEGNDSIVYLFNASGKILSFDDEYVLTKYYYSKDGHLIRRSSIYKDDESRGRDSVICEFAYDSQSRLIRYNQYPSKTFESVRHQMHVINFVENNIYDYSTANVLKKNEIVYRKVSDNYLIQIDGLDEFHYYKFRKGFQEVVVKNNFATFVAYLDDKSNLPFQITDQYRFSEITFFYK